MLAVQHRAVQAVHLLALEAPRADVAAADPLQVGPDRQRHVLACTAAWPP